ncbi:MAG: copper oxidase [SAR86 cluster bacterium]|uniref:Copper oxidase n=1 Tax=SAR86 cluster bacterium TaxID=2030880 RepID=A0A2A5B1C1_9GAMM|nr:MAG: copper oxidase [SAR86 cluster bacterium]
MSARIYFVLIALFFPVLVSGKTVSYEFSIDTKSMNVTGTQVEALAIADQIPAPTLRANIGDVLRVTFHNRLDVAASVHWHGILLPDDQDGVPFLNTQPIRSDESFTYEYPVLQAGTFWYHSHSDLQIQRGVYGSIIFTDPNKIAEAVQEEIVLFSDWTDENPATVLTNLKKDEDYYAYKKDAVQSWDRVIANGSHAISNRIKQSLTRMGPMDLADIGYDAFLINGKIESTVELEDSNADKVLLRLINGSTSSYFDVEYAGGAMTIIAADGQDVVPFQVKRLRISTAETYDVLVPVSQASSFELRGTSFDGSGFSSMFIGNGRRVLAPDIPAPNLFLMDHDDMDMTMPMSMNAEVMEHAEMKMPMGEGDDMGEVVEHMTDYEHLMARSSTALPVDREWREIFLTLTGNMERYVWSFNGRTLREDSQILIRKGENVRITLNNSTMMHHPLHLHGHFFRVINQHGERSPLKHTVNVPPMGKVVIEFEANEERDWLFHCHNQYHMKTGMNRVISYEENSTFNSDIERAIQPYLRWFSKSEFSAQSNFSDFETMISDERHGFGFELDFGSDDAYEAEASYTYFADKFFSAFAGVEKRKHASGESESYAIAGFNFTLPLLIGSEWRVNDQGDFRIELESELQFTRRIGFDWRWNTDDEYRYSLKYNVSKRWALTVNTDSEYGDGVGIQYLF